MATRPTLPYFAPPDRIPATLPTVANILSATRVLRARETTIVHIDQNFVVKYGKTLDLSLQEGENMLFVQQATNVPVPTVYALFHDEATGYNFIIQEYIPGDDLGKCWKSLDRKGKEAMCGQLRRYIDELRSLPPPGYFGGVWRQPVMDFYLTGADRPDRDLDATRVGPFDTEEQWVEAMLHTG